MLVTDKKPYNRPRIVRTVSTTSSIEDCCGWWRNSGIRVMTDAELAEHEKKLAQRRFPYPKTDAERLANLYEMLADSLDSVTDEELLEEAREQGVDIEKEAEQIRELLRDAVRRATKTETGSSG